MTQTPKISEALSRFEAAIDQLEASMVRQQEERATTQDLTGEAAALREDRARLAEELDEVRGNANRLLDANQKAEARIASAMEQIKSVLGEDE